MCHGWVSGVPLVGTSSAGRNGRCPRHSNAFFEPSTNAYIVEYDVGICSSALCYMHCVVDPVALMLQDTCFALVRVL